MNKIIVMIVFIFTSCSFYNSTTENNKQLNNGQDIIQQAVKNEVTEFLKKPKFSALSGVVYVNGKSYQFHFGKLINGKQANNRTIYEIGSIVKTHTGLLLSQAVYEKKVSLDDDIRIYLEGDYPNLVLAHNAPITIRHLITHTSGLPLFLNCNKSGEAADEKTACYEKYTKDDFFEELKNVKLIDNTGKNYHYSVGVQLVGYILERVYQLSFQELFEKYVFSRFSGNQNTFSELKFEEYSNISIGKDSTGIPMPLINGFYKYSGGAKSSTSSMLNYIKLYLESNDPIVKQAMYLLAGNNQYGRAFAWNTYHYDSDKKMLYHNGSTFGHSSWVALYPNQKIGIFLVTNVFTDDSQQKLNELSNKIIEQINKNAL